MSFAEILDKSDFATVVGVEGFCTVYSGADGFELFGDPAHHETDGFRLSIPRGRAKKAEPPADNDGTWIVEDIDDDAHAVIPFALVRTDIIRNIKEHAEKL